MQTFGEVSVRPTPPKTTKAGKHLYLPPWNAIAVEWRKLGSWTRALYRGYFDALIEHETDPNTGGAIVSNPGLHSILPWWSKQPSAQVLIFLDWWSRTSTRSSSILFVRQAATGNFTVYILTSTSRNTTCKWKPAQDLWSVRAALGDDGLKPKAAGASTPAAPTTVTWVNAANDKKIAPQGEAALVQTRLFNYASFATVVENLMSDLVILTPETLKTQSFACNDCFFFFIFT